MECRATGNPTPHIHWRRGDGRTIQVNKTKMSARSRNASVQGETKGNTLFLEKVSRDDSGVFVCVAQNGVDTKISSVSSVLTSFATVLDRYSGIGRPPSLTSNHLVLM